MEYYETRVDPIAKYFLERIKILSMTNKYLELQKHTPKVGELQAKGDPRLTPELIGELRAKKNQMFNQLESNEKEEGDRRKSINDLIDKHNSLEGKVMRHVEQQTTNQEDQFNRKLRERKDRSISRSLNKSGDDPRGNKAEDPADKGPGKPFKLYQSNLKFGGGEPPKRPGDGQFKGGA